MELQSSTLSFQNASTLSAADNAHHLSSAKQSTSQQLKSEDSFSGNIKNSLVKNIAPSSVVAKLASGPEAAVAVYSELVDVGNEKQPQSSVSSVSANQSSLSADSSTTTQREAQVAELKVVQQLSSRDREVRAHEQTHAAIGGSYAGAPSFDYTKGPDGQLYATSGEVSIDTSSIESDPRATLEKAQVIIRAALAVSDPSPADRQVAAQARSMEIQALSDIREKGLGSKNATEGMIEKEATKPSGFEQQTLERQEYQAEQELKSARQEKNQALSESYRKSNEASIEVLREYNVQISEIQEKLRKLNTQLVGSGAFGKVFPEGALVDQNV